MSDTDTPSYPWPVCDEATRAAWPTVSIDVYAHVIHALDDTGKVLEWSIEEQVRVINTAFEPGKFTFVLKDVRFVESAAWFRMGLSSDAELEAKPELGVKFATALNLYTANLKGTGSYGYARQPWEYEAIPDLDGIVIDYRYLPRNSLPTNRGTTGVHEVGHWLGLHHTYENFGEEPGDLVPDTPPQAVRSKLNRVCVANGSTDADDAGDGIGRNYMDSYSDTCRDEFTPGQFCRIRNVVLPKYKPWLLKKTGGGDA